GRDPPPRAARLRLVCRVTFARTGLPPTPAEVDAFLRDEAPDAYERLVERLLASPHYGEQQARHWLDVARYAETAGLANDFAPPPAARCRDYLGPPSHQDTPVDRF